MAGLIYEVKSMPTVLLTLLFGIPIGIGFYLIAGCKALWWIFVNNTGLSFWYYYNFTKLYKNLSKPDLQKMNANIDKRFKKDSKAYMAVKKYMQKVNERNAFVYDPKINDWD